MTWDDIPDWIEDEDHDDMRFFLTVNKTLDGTWSAAYTAHLEDSGDRICDYAQTQHVHTIIGLNNFATLDEVPTRLYYAIERYKKRGGFDNNQEFRKAK